jgi:hypothetical protein
VGGYATSLLHRAGDAIAQGVQTDAHEILTGTLMSAKLTGDQFTIEPLTSENQIVYPDVPTVWLWNVTPKWRGNRELTLVVSVRVNVAGSQESKDIPVYSQIVNVQPNWPYEAGRWVLEYWTQIAFFLGGPALLVGVFTYLFKLLRRPGDSVPRAHRKAH